MRLRGRLRRFARGPLGAPFGQFGPSRLGGLLFVLKCAQILGAGGPIGFQPRLRSAHDARLPIGRQFGRLGGTLDLLLFGLHLAPRHFELAAFVIGLRTQALFGELRLFVAGFLRGFLAPLLVFGILGPPQIPIGFDLDPLDLRHRRAQLALRIPDTRRDEETALALNFAIVSGPLRSRAGLIGFIERRQGLGFGLDRGDRKARAQRLGRARNRSLLRVQSPAAAQE